MAQTTGIKLETTSTVIQKRAIANLIDNIDPKETPFLDFFGFNGASKFNIQNTPGNYKIEWIGDGLRTLSGTLAGGTHSSTLTALTTSTTAYLAAGDVIQIDDEFLWVSAVTGVSATVTRAFAGTTNASHASDAAWTVVGNARTEGATATYSPIETVSTNYNYIQTLQKGLTMSRHAAGIAQWGIDNEWAYQVDKSLPELFRILERSIFNNPARVARTAQTVPAYMGGLDVFITDNTLSTAASLLTIAILESMMMSCDADGGSPDVIALNPATRVTLTNLYNNSNYLRVDRETDALGMVISFLDTPWGRLRMLEGRNIPTTRMYFLQSDYIGLWEAEPFFWKNYEPAGDYLAAEIIGDYSLVVKNDKAHAKFVLS